MKRTSNVLIIFLLFSILAFPQERKSLRISKTEEAPKIDGRLDDSVWQFAEQATDFVQFRPEMGVALGPNKKTIVKMTYDDDAIYIGAHLKDNPEDIQRQLTSRDNFGNSDFFGVILNPNNDAQNDIEFFVFSSGTQADAVASPDNGEDFGWNAVWDSKVTIVEDGWVVEMKIPYAALRFSNDPVQTWGLQFHRRFRIDNTQYSWNAIDRTKGNVGLYHGELKGIENIKPPTRLSFYPFVSSLQKSYEGDNHSDYSIGLDLKYGLTENFTLDATLIPDFSQAGFDNLVLNLGPFEQTFSEQRQFFTEGVDLFNKGNLFFSRRVGNAPTGTVELSGSERIKNFPTEVKTLNALKVSGRTKKGLGVGFFNALTAKAEAVIENTQSGEIRKEVVEPLANYNILVIDQQFNRNSSVSLINTNVVRSGEFRDANVTGLLFDISNKSNKYNFSGEGKTSRLNLAGDDQIGYSARISAAKVYGKYRARIGYTMADRQYDINDLGLQFRNNFSNFFYNASYRIFEPTKRLNNFSVSTWGNINRLFDPNVYTGNSIGVNVNGQTKSLHWFGGNINTQIGKQYDYFEPRDTENNRFFIYENWLNGNVWLDTNNNKRLSFGGNAGFGTLFEEGRDLFNYWLGFSPTMRFDDKFRMSYNLNYQNNKGNRGFVTNTDNDIIFGQRDQQTVTNSISGSYNFSPLNALTLTFRNYWTTVTYDYSLYSLQDNGRLDVNSGYNKENIGFDPDINFMTWNLDLRYAWQFAPGSQLIALYRNQLFNSTTESENSYSGSLSSLFDRPIEHTFSLRLIYFIDYNNLKGLFQSKSAI